MDKNVTPPSSSKKDISNGRLKNTKTNGTNSTSPAAHIRQKKKTQNTGAVNPIVRTPPTVSQLLSGSYSDDSRSPFAGAKFSYTPPPHKLPKPPGHWYHRGNTSREWPIDSDSSQSSQSCSESS